MKLSMVLVGSVVLAVATPSLAGDEVILEQDLGKVTLADARTS